MGGKFKKAEQQISEPLQTRHVFLDTQVYRALGYTSENRMFQLLAKKIASHRIVLHTSDITLLEIKRQLKEEAAKRYRELTSIEKDLAYWRKDAPSAIPTASFDFDADQVAVQRYKKIESFLKGKCNTIVHEALTIDPKIIFAQYFDRRPPFDGEDSKEFPDAFIIESLKSWCKSHDARINIVTQDKAILRAAENENVFFPISDIHKLLARANADLGAAGETVAEAVFNHSNFDHNFEVALGSRIGDVVFGYYGEDLFDGEAYGGSLISIDQIDDYSIVCLDHDSITLIVGVKATVDVEIQYKDISDAIYDNEDGTYYGAEDASCTINEQVSIEVVVDIEIIDADIRDMAIITRAC